MRVPDDYQFDARSPVGRYWLIHGVGFTVCHRDGRRLGVVEEVLVDPVAQRAESVTVRRRGLLPSRRHETIDPELVEAVVPASRLFVVEPRAGDDAAPPSREVGRARVGAAAASAGAAIVALGRWSRPFWRRIGRAGAASLPVLRRLLGHLGAGLVVIGRYIRRGAAAAARASVVAAGRARDNAPRLAAWSSKRARAAGRGTRALLVVLGTYAGAGARRAAALTRTAGRALGDLAVLIAMAVVAGMRWIAATARPRAQPPADDDAEDDPLSLTDADAPLGRDAGEDASTPSTTRRPPA